MQCKSHWVSFDDMLVLGLYQLDNPLFVCVCLAVNDVIPSDVIADIIKLECQHPERNNTKLLITVRNVST